MIASWRGLAAAAAIAVVLAVVLAIDLGRAPGRVDRALVPGFDPARVTELVWDHPGRPAIRVARGGAGWRIVAPAPAPADASAVDDVLAALRGARWHRRGAPGPVHATLTVVAGGERRVLGIASSIAGTDQTWIADGDRGVLVDRWIAGALDRELLGLRIRRPFAELGGAPRIVVEGDVAGAAGAPGHVDLRLEGAPRRLVRPAALVLAADLASALDHALRDLEIVHIPDAPVTGAGLAITVAGDAQAPAQGAVVVELRGPCPGAPERVAVSGTVGDGCIEHAAATTLQRVIERLQQPPAQLAERRPVPFEPARVVLADATALELSPPRIGGASADPSRVAELVFALGAPAEIVALPAGPAVGHLVVTGRAEAAITLDLFDHVVVRRGEPIALRPAPGAWSLLVRPSRALRDLALWLEEPTTVTTVQIDDIAYERGAVIGAWTRRPPRAADADAAALEALVGQLAAPRALGFIDVMPPIVHRVTLVITPPAGAPSRHVLALGAARADGCPVQVDRDTVLLPAAVCARVAGLAR